MVQPIYYMQTDSRWAKSNYSAKGEQKTIAEAGCGVACSAMVIATLKDKNVTPVHTANWSMSHGYKALNQGTYYSYFVPQFDAYGIKCKQLNWSNLYGKSSSEYHTEALNALKNNDWVIACMGKGNWTSAGHFIILYGYKDGYVYINDPASKASGRVKNTWNLFASQVKYMWTISVPNSLKNSTISTPSATTTASTRNYLMKGDKGSEVKKMQENLIYIGYSCGRYGADGDFGNDSDSALRKFQADYKLTVDGKYGANSKAKLESAVASKKAAVSKPVSTPTASAYTKVQFIKDVQKAIGAGIDGIAGNETLSKTVTVSKFKNNRHAVVKPIQKYLNAQGFNAGAEDGIAGAKFDTAIKAYQKAKGCVADGEVTAKNLTWKKLLGLA